MRMRRDKERIFSTFSPAVPMDMNLASFKDLVTESEVHGGHVIGEAADAGSGGAQQCSTSSVSQESRSGRGQQRLEGGLIIRSPPIKDIILFGCHVLKIKG